MVHAFGLGTLAFLLAAFPGWPGAEAACYYPSGRIAPNDIPCRDDTPHATCCGQGYACLSNGICQATGEELQAPDASEFVRGACTDREWRSSSCPLFCIEEDVDFLDGGNGIFKCGNTTEDLYFCINTRTVEETGICEERRNVLFFPGTPSAITTIGVAPHTTSSSTSTTVSSSSSTSEAVSSTLPDSSDSTRGPETQVPAGDADEPTSSSNLGAIIGGVIGGIAVIALAVVGGWFLARRRAANGGGNGGSNGDVNGYGYGAAPTMSPSFNNTPTYTDASELTAVWKPPVQQGPYELAHVQREQELPAEQQFTELPAGYR
ncbi:hypothetical protein MMYC01_205230 [Madurella mycetomatis]|uniref:Carcinoembryonic antigen-related cell adhesion molecule 1 n=1 Tax=Madurella mycetomatis TaxID=100816 RepID=A0A175W094_9PEZI|nr:hypothetical protein MMYC01_205230 [Madurella mycetomatis]